MRIKTFSFIIAGLLCGGVAKAQLQRIVLQGDGAPQVFTTVEAAVAAAQPDDKLYFSGGTFTAPAALTISVPLHFIGAGTSPDSAAVTNPTIIGTVTGNIILTTGASGSTFTGIRFSAAGDLQYGTSAADDDPTGVVFERCSFDGRVVVHNSTDNGTSSTVFNECVLRSNLYGLQGTLVSLTRCVLDYQQGTGAEVSGFDGGALTMDHCIGLGTRIGNSTNCIISNSIFTRTTAPFWQSNGMVLTNNLLVSSALVSNMTPGSAVGNVLGVAATDIFISEDNTDFDWYDDLRLQPTSVGVGMATDGTDVGIYGTNSPFKPGGVPYNPHFRSAVIAPATNPNGDLPVNIRVAAQTH